MMRLFSTTNFTLLMAGTPGVVTAFVVHPEGPMATQVHSINYLFCENPSCNAIVDISTLPKTFVQELRNQDTSLAIRESSLTIRNTSLAIRDTSLALRDPQPVSAESTTTATVTSQIITLTMSCWGTQFTPVDGTTYHCSTTVPPVSNFASISSVNNGPAIMNNGTPAKTITSPESTFSVMPAPSITSARPFTTISNVSTTIITPASDLTSTASNLNSTTYTNTTGSISRFPTITLTSLTTVDPPSETNTMTSTKPALSSTTTSPSNNDAPQSSGQEFKFGYKKLGLALITGLVVNVVLAAVL